MKAEKENEDLEFTLNELIEMETSKEDSDEIERVLIESEQLQNEYKN